MASTKIDKEPQSAPPEGTLIQHIEELLDAPAACAVLGGNRPIHPATLWRGVKAGIFPRPVEISPNVKRWLRSELIEAIERRAAARDQAA